MTSTQRLTLEQLETKKKLNALLGVDPGDLTDEQRAEMDTLTKRLEQSDTELRAAILAQGDDEARALAAHGTDGADGESAERRRLLDGVTIADYLTPASSGRGIEGRAAELNAALEVPVVGAGGGVAVPWHVLETRAFTDTAANDGSNMQRPILQRIFGPGIMDKFRRQDGFGSGRAVGMAPDNGGRGSGASEGRGGGGGSG